MDDVDESSSENNISVTNTSRFYGSPHPINKNACLLPLTKDEDGSNQPWALSRIPDNLHCKHRKKGKNKTSCLPSIRSLNLFTNTEVVRTKLNTTIVVRRVSHLAQPHVFV